MKPDRFIVGCAAAIVLSIVAAFTVLVVTNHSDDAYKAISYIVTGVSGLASVGAVGYLRRYFDVKVNAVSDQIKNGALHEPVTEAVKQAVVESGLASSIPGGRRAHDPPAVTAPAPAPVPAIVEDK